MTGSDDTGRDWRAFRGEDGIVRCVVRPGTTVTLAVAQAIADAANRLLERSPGPLLVCTDGIVGFERPARDHLASQTLPAAIAVVGVSPVGRVLGTLFVSLRRSNGPQTRFFAAEEEAVRWLRKVSP